MAFGDIVNHSIAAGFDMFRTGGFPARAVLPARLGYTVLQGPCLDQNSGGAIILVAGDQRRPSLGDADALGQVIG